MLKSLIVATFLFLTACEFNPFHEPDWAEGFDQDRYIELIHTKDRTPAEESELDKLRAQCKVINHKKRLRDEARYR